MQTEPASGHCVQSIPSSISQIDIASVGFFGIAFVAGEKSNGAVIKTLYL